MSDSISPLQSLLFPSKGSPAEPPVKEDGPPAEGSEEGDLPDETSALLAQATAPVEAEAQPAALPAPFWSLLPAQDLRSYTWYGPWAPPGLADLAPTADIVGTAAKNFLLGSNQGERLEGLGGADLIMAGGGDDWLFGGLGNDALLGELGDDVLLGDEGDDYLEGGRGNDWLFGGDGKDTLTGWQGNDVFAFLLQSPDGPGQSGLPTGLAAANEPDEVTDFTPGDDLILVAGLLSTQPPADFDPFAAYIQLSAVANGAGTRVTVNQTNALGSVISTDIAVLNGVAIADLSASSFVFA